MGKYYVIAGFHREEDENFFLKMGMIDCPETSVNNYHYRLHDSPEVRLPYFTC